MDNDKRKQMLEKAVDSGSLTRQTGSLFLMRDYALVFQVIGRCKYPKDWCVVIKRPEISCKEAQVSCTWNGKKPDVKYLADYDEWFLLREDLISKNKNTFIALTQAQWVILARNSTRLIFDDNLSNGRDYGLIPSITYIDYYGQVINPETRVFQNKWKVALLPYSSTNRSSVCTENPLVSLGGKVMGFNTTHLTKSPSLRNLLWLVVQLHRFNYAPFGEIRSQYANQLLAGDL